MIGSIGATIPPAGTPQIAAVLVNMSDLTFLATVISAASFYGDLAHR
jgi:hypothetical protein